MREADPVAAVRLLDTVTGLRLDRSGFDWHPSLGRVLRADDRVVLATTRRQLDVLMTGV